MTNPILLRMQAYTTPEPNGDITIDCEGMAVDLVTALKIIKTDKAEFLHRLSVLWDEIEVIVKEPNAGHA